MYTEEEREKILKELESLFKSATNIEGVIQLGSSIYGFKDCYSDLDLMLVYEGDFETIKNDILKYLDRYNPYFIKDYVRSNDVSILIVICENQLELNISLVPYHKLSAQSKNFRVLYDQKKRVQEKMNETYEKLEVANKFDSDFMYQIAYFVRKIKVETNRSQFILALQYFEYIRQRIIELLVFNMKVKSPQFKDYQDIDDKYLSIINNTYQLTITKESICNKTELLFDLALECSKSIDFDSEVYKKLAAFGGNV